MKEAFKLKYGDYFLDNLGDLCCVQSLIKRNHFGNAYLCNTKQSALDKTVYERNILKILNNTSGDVINSKYDLNDTIASHLGERGKIIGVGKEQNTITYQIANKYNQRSWIEEPDITED